MSKPPEIYNHSKSESLMSRVLKLFFTLGRINQTLGRQLSNLDDFDNDPAPVPASVKNKIDVVEESFEGRTVWTLTPKGSPSNKAIFYIHGGAYVLNMVSMQWTYLAKIVTETNATIMVMDYPLAPQNHAEEAYSYLHSLYERFVDTYKSRDILFLADSAGAGLAIAFAQYLNEVGLLQPKRLILSSPWLDISLTNPDIANFIKDDKVLDVSSLQKAGKLFAGNINTKDPKVSPIYGRFDNIGRISMFMGTGEIFVADARALVKRLQEENIGFDYYEYPKMVHCWLLLPIPTPEANVALNQIVDLIKQ